MPDCGPIPKPRRPDDQGPAEVPDPTLLDLTGRTIADLTGDDTGALAAIMRRLFDPAERELLDVSAFQSAL